MKLHLNNPPDGAPVINGYGNNYVDVAGELHHRSVVLTPNGIFTDDELPSNSESLSGLHLDKIVNNVGLPEVFLLGDGVNSPIIKTEWFVPFAKVGAPLEVMSLSAACRTYNIMVGDARHVIAILLIGD